MPITIIAEIGINHNGDVDIAKKLIDGAASAGCDAVKFQKRTVEEVYSREALEKYRESPWGTTNGQQKHGLEFGREEYDEIDRYCREKGIDWFASAWDLKSQDFLAQYDLKYNKIASALLGHADLLEKVAAEGRYTFISSGMCELEELDRAVAIFRKYECPFEVMHCNSSYPMPPEDANLKVMDALRSRYGCDVGYSGHESGLIVSCAAAALGATSIERHITLDRSMYGSDQAASVEIAGMARLVNYIRTIEAAMGDGVKRITEKEHGCRASLWRTGDTGEC
ncbi:N-acetylneuraminate synthase family protein [uncultured Pseudodesulfovibrio sp.]|uniref:N-acetylneuraminate synthase family protein n=1 Tax=uncultured Pseudodesulfovibrio sp. TaxID=2035858 RepID=UPI0029C96C7B|nr:N-acetylneuraminate synthase family protein [uncultured Pseudodesulfovibrio sp.]